MMGMRPRLDSAGSDFGTNRLFLTHRPGPGEATAGRVIGRARREAAH
jgi:hypothetical protein